MALERNDHGTETTDRPPPSEQSPPQDNPGAPGYPSRRESLAAARTETGAQTERTDAGGTTEKETTEPKSDTKSGQNDQTDQPRTDSPQTTADDSPRNDEQPEKPGTADTGTQSSTPRLDSLRAASIPSERTDTNGTSSPPETRTARPAEGGEAQPQDQTMSSEHEAKDRTAMQPDQAQPQSEPDERSPRETSEQPADGSDTDPAQETPEPAGPHQEKPEPARGGTRTTDGSWAGPQEAPPTADDQPEPMDALPRVEQDKTSERPDTPPPPRQDEPGDEPQPTEPIRAEVSTSDTAGRPSERTDIPDPGTDDPGAPVEPARDLAEQSPQQDKQVLGGLREEVDPTGAEGESNTTLDVRDERTGDQIAESEPDSRSDRLRRKFFQQGDGIGISQGGRKASNSVQDILNKPSPTGHPETRTSPTMSQPDHHGVEAGNALSAAVVAGVVITEVVRWCRSRRTQRTGV
ncbi:hypothetical protein GCM10010191_36310 [Actinomadura vinacea]|uniref:Uncharacterized protein n=1 Tax=Actinomadura vinacea TaxID=115336 RepID=A0ABP5WB20_9ACTN